MPDASASSPPPTLPPAAGVPPTWHAGPVAVHWSPDGAALRLVPAPGDLRLRAATRALAAWMQDQWQVGAARDAADGAVEIPLRWEAASPTAQGAFWSAAWWSYALQQGGDPFSAVGTLAQSLASAPLQPEWTHHWLPELGLVSLATGGAHTRVLALRPLDDPWARPALRVSVHSPPQPLEAEQVVWRLAITMGEDPALRIALHQQGLALPDERIWWVHPQADPGVLSQGLGRVERWFDHLRRWEALGMNQPAPAAPAADPARPHRPTLDTWAAQPVPALGTPHPAAPAPPAPAVVQPAAAAILPAPTPPAPADPPPAGSDPPAAVAEAPAEGAEPPAATPAPMLPEPGDPGPWRVDLLDAGRDPARSANLLARAMGMDADVALRLCENVPAVLDAAADGSRVRLLHTLLSASAGAVLAWARADDTTD